MDWIEVVLPVVGLLIGLVVRIPKISNKLAKAREFGKEVGELFKAADKAIQEDSIGGANVSVEEMKDISSEAKEAWVALKNLVKKEDK